MNAGQRTRSREEVASAIRAFPGPDWIRLRKASIYFAYGRPIEPEDLLQEGLLRAISSRVCPTEVDVVRFVVQAMRSVASGEVEKAAARPSIAAAPKTGDALDPARGVEDPEPNAEQRLVQEAARAEIRKRIRTEIFVLFDDDPAARDILEGEMADMTPQELQELTGLDKTGYNSKRRLIRRRLNDHFPKGWKP